MTDLPSLRARASPAALLMPTLHQRAARCPSGEEAAGPAPTCSRNSASPEGSPLRRIEGSAVVATANGSVSRRAALLGLASATAAATSSFPSPAIAQAAPRIAVIGGGFAGATVAQTLRQLLPAPKAIVTMVEHQQTYVSCPLSNLVLGGERHLTEQQFEYSAPRLNHTPRVNGYAEQIDYRLKSINFRGGSTYGGVDRLILAPGVDMRFDALPGYDAAAAEILPHAWKAGAQTQLLQRQLEAMPDGGTVLMSVPDNPFRCPPGPYERASLIAHYLKTRKPRSKLIVLDAKDQFSKQRLFLEAWKQLYPDHLEWVPLSKGGRVTEVIAGERTLVTEFGRHKGDVINVIPPQKAGAIAHAAGVADKSGWCPVDPVTFESRLVPGVHVIGDAAIMGAMPKSAFAANAQAKACAAAIADILAGRMPKPPKLINTCYSLVAPDYGISVAGVYEPVNGQLTEVKGAGGTSPLDAPLATRKAEALLAHDWFQTITAEVFG